MEQSPAFAPRAEYFDPFAETDTVFEPSALFEEISARYQNNEISHDYTADKFVADTEALLLDSQFTDNFVAFERIASAMHQLCSDDHALTEALNESSILEKSYSQHDGHSHNEDTLKNKDNSKKKTKKKHDVLHSKRSEANTKRFTFDDLLKMLLRRKALPKKP